MGEVVYLPRRAWIIVYGDTGEPALEDFFNDHERAEAVAALVRMTTERPVKVICEFL